MRTKQQDCPKRCCEPRLKAGVAANRHMIWLHLMIACSMYLHKWLLSDATCCSTCIWVTQAAAPRLVDCTSGPGTRATRCNQYVVRTSDMEWYDSLAMICALITFTRKAVRQKSWRIKPPYHQSIQIRFDDTWRIIPSAIDRYLAMLHQQHNGRSWVGSSLCSCWGTMDPNGKTVLFDFEKRPSVSDRGSYAYVKMVKTKQSTG